MSIGRISNHSADTKSDAPRCIDDQLGRASDRFFGEGFTLVRHELTRTAHSNNRIDFTISATYPDDWSRKNGRSQKPHLSSVDAMVLTAQMIEEYLNHNESTHGTTTLWISHCSLRPGQQPVDVSRPLQASMEIESHSEPAEEVLSFQCRLQSFIVRMTARQAPSTLGRKSGDSSSLSYYGDGYKRVSRQLGTAERVAGAARRTAPFVLSDPVDSTGHSGLESGHGSVVTFVDANIIAAQLGQVSVYELDGIERKSSRTLWLRKAEFNRSSPPVGRRMTGVASVEVVKTRLIERRGARWRTAELRASIDGVEVDYSLAHDISAEGRE